jgi:hypothetical protein
MFILITKSENVPDQPNLIRYNPTNLYPHEIRAQIQEIINKEENFQDTEDPEFEYTLTTLNTTVISMVKKEGILTYDDVKIWKDGKFEDILTVYDEDWLSLFDLGDLFERGHF